MNLIYQILLKFYPPADYRIFWRFFIFSDIGPEKQKLKKLQLLHVLQHSLLADVGPAPQHPSGWPVWKCCFSADC
jgi:hypothetical protein